MRLLTAAGYEDFDRSQPPIGGAHAREFEEILNALQYIGDRKVDEYGDGRMQVESADYDTKMLWSDLYRKSIRINELLAEIKRMIWTGQPIEGHKLQETFGDLAVYCVRGIQIVERLREKGLLHADGTHYRG